MNLSLDLKANDDSTLTCLVCRDIGCELYFVLKDHRHGRHSAIGIHRDCAEHNIKIQARDEAHLMLHPNGECTCAGEGTCGWCQDSLLKENPPNKYLAGLADAACQILQDIRLQLRGTPWYDDADDAWESSMTLLRTVSFIGERQ